MTVVKICGITYQEDIQVLTRYPVWALGFIQVEKSPRYIKPEKAKKLVSLLPPSILSVGVFQDHSIQEVKQIRKYCGFSLVQLHGNESPSYCNRIGMGVIRAFQVRNEFNFEQLGEFHPFVNYFLFDTYVPGKGGGTGQTFPWEILREMRKIDRPFLIAGGLSPENIQACLQTITPFGVDVNSGVESSPGKKDAQKLRLFFQKVNTGSIPKKD